MGSPFRTPEFLRLFKLWNRKLERSGHREIEDFTLRDPPLKTWESTRWNSTDSIQNEWRQQYYEMAESLLRLYPFKSKEHKRIWQLHCEGFSVRKIAQQLDRKKFSKSSIQNVILRIKRKSGLSHG